MKRLPVLVLLTVTIPCTLSGQSIKQSTTPPSRAGDEAAIRRIVANWQQAWDHFDARLLAHDYAADADFKDAYGYNHKGAGNIIQSMTNLFAAPRIRGRRSTWQEPMIRFIRPDVAIVYADYTTVGQKTPTGEDVPTRNTHSIRVVTKDHGQWQIVSHFISDARERAASPKKAPP